MRKGIALLLCLVLLPVIPALSEGIPLWRDGTPVLDSILAYVEAVSDEQSPDFVPKEQRSVVFDSDGTLYGERFPTYLDTWLLLHRLLHDASYEAVPSDRAWAEEAEAALLRHEAEPDSPRSGGQMAAEAFQGFTVEQYRAYARQLLETKVEGFEGMVYGDGFFRPMEELVRYLYAHDFTIFIVSGAERNLLRELITGHLDAWVPPYCVIGSTFSLAATGQGEKAARSYNMTGEDEVLLEGNLVSKTQKFNKVVSIVNEIGAVPILAFGNTSGDFSMGTYVLQHGGRAYMLLCDDVERDYGDLEVAEKFRKECEKLGFETISMRDCFETIYGENFRKVEEETLAPAA